MGKWGNAKVSLVWVCCFGQGDGSCRRERDAQKHRQKAGGKLLWSVVPQGVKNDGQRDGGD